MPHVRSSVIASVHYDDMTATLFIEFKNGRLYAYTKVPRSAYLQLIKAASVGAYFNRRIRPKYRGTLVRRRRPSRG
jgi:hypothetical protein